MKHISSLKGNKKVAIVLIALGIIIPLLLPMLKLGNYIITVLTSCFIFAALGISWNIIGGYGSQVSWCHTAFVAIGGYMGFVLFNRFGISGFLGLIPGVALSAFVAFIIGFLSFRVRGPFFSLSTIAFSEIVRILLLYFKDVTNGASGMFVPYHGHSLWKLTFKNDLPFYYIFFVIMVIFIVFCWRFEKSKTGYYLRAIKEDEDAAISLGIKTYKIKLIAFVISACMASLVGTFYAFFLTYIEPNAFCGLAQSIKIGCVTIIGGISMLWGPVIGAFIIVPLTELTNALLGANSGANLAMYGLVLMLIVIFRPKGIISLFIKSDEIQTNFKIRTKKLFGRGGSAS